MDGPQGASKESSPWPKLEQSWARARGQSKQITITVLHYNSTHKANIHESILTYTVIAESNKGGLRAESPTWSHGRTHCSLGELEGACLPTLLGWALHGFPWENAGV